MFDDSELEVTPRVTCYRAEADGSFMQVDAASPDVYIRDTDVSALFNRDFTGYVRNAYGPIIGVVQKTVRSMTPAKQHTLLRILG